MDIQDPFDLQRFVAAQDSVIGDVRAELRSGRKEGHWMWFVFPQLKGLGYSSMANRYSISSREEAAAFLNHSILGARLRECTELVNAIRGRSIEQIFDHPDYLKFQSSMTLFAEVAPSEGVFERALQIYFDGHRDPRTIDLLSS